MKWMIRLCSHFWKIRLAPQWTDARRQSGIVRPTPVTGCLSARVWRRRRRESWIARSALKLLESRLPSAFSITFADRFPAVEPYLPKVPNIPNRSHRSLLSGAARTAFRSSADANAAKAGLKRAQRPGDSPGTGVQYAL